MSFPEHLRNLGQAFRTALDTVNTSAIPEEDRSEQKEMYILEVIDRALDKEERALEIRKARSLRERKIRFIDP